MFLLFPYNKVEQTFVLYDLQLLQNTLSDEGKRVNANYTFFHKQIKLKTIIKPSMQLL